MAITIFIDAWNFMRAAIFPSCLWANKLASCGDFLI